MEQGLSVPQFKRPLKFAMTGSKPQIAVKTKTLFTQSKWTTRKLDCIIPNILLSKLKVYDIYHLFLLHRVADFLSSLEMYYQRRSRSGVQNWVCHCFCS